MEPCIIEALYVQRSRKKMGRAKRGLVLPRGRLVRAGGNTEHGRSGSYLRIKITDETKTCALHVHRGTALTIKPSWR